MNIRPSSNSVRPSGERPALCALMRTAQLGGPDGASALESLMTELHLIVWHFLRPRLTGWRDAHDVTNDCAQETVVRLFLAFERCRAESDAAVIAWACTTARHALQDLLRDPESGIMAAQFAASIADVRGAEELDSPNRRALALVGMCPDAAAGQRAEEYEARETLLAIAVDAYNAAARETGEMLWWRLVMGAEWTEVARHLGTTASGAKRRFQRAQCALRHAVLRRIQALPGGSRHSVMALARHYWDVETSQSAPQRPPSTRSCRRRAFHQHEEPAGPSVQPVEAHSGDVPAVA